MSNKPIYNLAVYFDWSKKKFSIFAFEKYIDY